MATTPNLGLHKPARTDLVSVVTDINNNMDTLDSKIGAVPAGHDVEEQITTLSDQIATQLSTASIMPLTLSGGEKKTGIHYPCFIVGGRVSSGYPAYAAFIDNVGSEATISASGVCTVALENSAISITNNFSYTVSFIVIQYN